MPHYATLSDTPSIYDDKVTGYAVEGTEFVLALGGSSFITIIVLASTLTVLGLSTPLFVTISESIEIMTDCKVKPKLYYHFWSSVVLIIFGIWGYGVIYHIITLGTPYAIVLMLMIMTSFFGTLTTILVSVGGRRKPFYAPFFGCCCCFKKLIKCRTCWSWFMTITGMYFILSLVAYLLYAAPTIVFVYYLYPTRTLIRVPFIIGAIFYTITLQSWVFYQFEKVIYIIYNYIMNRFCAGHKHNNTDEAKRPLVENNTINSYGNQSLEMNTESRSRVTFCQCNYQLDKKYIEDQHRLNKEYYKEKLEEDLKIISKRCHIIVAFTQLLAGIVILIAFIYGEIVLAKLVFKQTNTTDINSLLALLPTVIVSGFAWFGRSFIFDVREDLKELSKKESVEEKILNALNEQVKLQRSRIEQESQNRQGNNEDADIQSDTAEDTV